MASIHFICKKAEDGSGWIGRNGVTLIDKTNHIYESGKWDLNLVEAQKLVGGDVYLHESKQEKSAFGGKVLDVYESTADDVSRSKRVSIKFQFTPEHRGVSWSGASHGMAWCSGIIES